MNYDQLSKYLAEEMSPEEKETFLASISNNQAGWDEATRLMNVWAAAQMGPAATDRKIAGKGWGMLQDHIKKPVNNRIWTRVAAIAVLVFVVGAVTFFVGRHSGNGMVAYHTLTVPAGQYAQLTLADGSEIWLNSRSTLVYPDRFTGKKREVKFEGEGFFKVASDKEHPFIVKTEGLNVVATGTQFNVSAYDDDTWVSTTLVEGQVHMHSQPKNIRHALNEGHIAIYDKTTGTMETKPVDAEMQISWTYGEFQFKDMPMGNIAKRLERNFNVTFVFKDDVIKNRPFTGTFYRHQSVDHILNVIEISTERMDYSIKNDTIYISQK